MSTATPSAPQTPLESLTVALSSQFVERESHIQAMLTAVLASEHVFLLGPAGVAKSALCRAVAQSLSQVYWERLLTLFSTPDELYGPVMLSALQNDTYERNTKGMLPEANIGLIDECWKANSGVLNSLLTISNERLYHNGTSPVACPLVSLMGASNELPSGDELKALYDRFMIRLYVEPIADKSNFLTMLRAPAITLPPKVSIDLPREHAQVALVHITPLTFEAMADMWSACKKQGLYVSDRRWRKTQSLIRATAHLANRSSSDPEDLSVLEHVLWETPDQRSSISRLVQSVINPSASKAVQYLDAATEAVSKLPPVPKKGQDRKDFLVACTEANTTLNEIISKLEKLGTSRKVNEIRAKVQTMKQESENITRSVFGL